MRQVESAKNGPKRIQLHLRFKGERNYLQGPDLFAAAQASLQSCLGLDWAIREIRLHRLTESQCDLVPGSEAARVADLLVHPGSRDSVQWSLVARGDPVTESYPYDEDGVVAPSTIAGDSISMATRSSANAIEEIVALTKRLHLARYLGASGKWLFVGLRLVRPLIIEADGPFRITLQRSLGGRLTQSAIEADGVHLGEIDFALLTRPGPR